MVSRLSPLLVFVLALYALGGGASNQQHPKSDHQQLELDASERRLVQREILAVLGLHARPRPRPRAPPASAPRFMLDLYHAMAGDDDQNLDDEDDGLQEPGLGRADLVMSFVNMVEHDQALTPTEPCWKEFWFDLTQIPSGEAVTAAEFRIYKVPSAHQVKRTLHLSIFEVLGEQSKREADLLPLDLQIIQPEDEGWLVLDITRVRDHWLLNRHKDLGLRLYVKTEDGHSVEPSLAGLLGRRAPRPEQPFMVTFFRASPNPVPVSRVVRSLRSKVLEKTNKLLQQNNFPGIFDGVHGSHRRLPCRRHELYVSFRDLKWLDWIIAPQGYLAYYCEGDCFFPLDACMNATNHALMQSLIHLMKPDVVPKPSCAPTKLSSASVLYYDNNNNVVLRKQRNMVVDSCGCQ
ncbi:PREDICTED: bone morphogenetic protein 8B [Elephantulus edwardii]|uniref:bone morphogenetic protein 8B n=1 Tax=Elephantulus edwardii TaxID=28737 RepID=UPI0003F0EEDB|nr:PREDICTED: bone morphogenetic protein 8B [Elephantulus edwardii]